MSATSIIKVIITGDDVGLRKAALGSAGELEKTGKAGGGMGKMLGLGFAAAAAGAVAFGISAIKSADSFDLAHARLVVAIKDSGGQWGTYSKAVQDALNKGTDFGFHITDTTNALAQATTGLGSTKKALDLLPLAEDMAKAKGVDLQSAMLLVTKASEGQTKALKQSGIDLPIAAAGAVKLQGAQDKLRVATNNLGKVEADINAGRLKGPAAAAALTKAHEAVRVAQEHVNNAEQAGTLIIAALEKHYGGSAAAASDTFAGKTAAIGAKFDALKISVGLTLEKGLLALSAWMTKSGVPALDQFDRGLQRIGGDLQPVVKLVQDLVIAGQGLTHVVGTVVQALGLTNSGGSNPIVGTQGGAPQPKKYYGPVPHKAAGGPVQAGVSYQVGELGPEMFTPGVSGMITPHGGGNTTIVHLNVHGADPLSTVRALQLQARRNGTLV